MNLSLAAIRDRLKNFSNDLEFHGMTGDHEKSILVVGSYEDAEFLVNAASDIKTLLSMLDSRS